MYKVRKNQKNSSCYAGVVRNGKSFGVILTPVVVPGLRVTRCRMVSQLSDQIERKRKPVSKKVNQKRKTRASKRTNPVLRDGHPQDVAHAKTVEEAESSPETELYSITS